MRVLHSNENPYDGVGPAIFLAGPTPRSKDVLSWRPEAISTLSSLGFNGTVLVPEPFAYDYLTQVQWERIGLFKCNVIAFWVPRDLKTMPAFITNIEFGYWMAKDPKKVVYGRPPHTPKNDYLDWLFKVEQEQLIDRPLKIQPAITMQELFQNALALMV